MNAALNYGFDADSGVLSLRTGSHLTRVRWTPKPLAEEQSPKGHWLECWPEQTLVIPAGSNSVRLRIGQLPCANTHVLAEFRRLIPEPVATFVQPFQYRQWPLLTLLNDVPDVLAWGIENPILAYCVANNAEFRGISEQAAAFEARRHCMQKQKTILKWLKFPATPSMVKLLKKIVPEAVEPWILRSLRAAILADARVIEMLSYHSHINFGMIALFTHKNMRSLVTRELLSEVEVRIEDRMNSPTADLLGSALNKMAQLPNHPAPHPFLSLRAIQEFHDAINSAFQAHTRNHDAQNRKRLTLPEPPVPGTDSILPITSEAILKAEGRQMKNCIATYAARIKKGEAYAYRILEPERATLLVVRDPLGIWRIADFRRQHNNYTSKTATLLVSDWLAKNQKRVP
ncbi:MAG: hypothetical protein WCN95_12335 [bacterium]